MYAPQRSLPTSNQQDNLSDPMYAWADAEELTKILESMPGNDRTFPLTQRGLGLTESDDYFVEDLRRLSTDQLQSRPRGSVAPQHLIGPFKGSSKVFREYTTMPSKAQRLMGIGTEVPVYQKSSFHDSDDDDEDSGAVQTGKGWANMGSRSKSEPRALFLSGQRRMSRSESQNGATIRAKSTLTDDSQSYSQEGALLLDAPSSRWASLGNRLRNSSVAPTKMRLKKGPSPPPLPPAIPSHAASSSSYKRSSDPFIHAFTNTTQIRSPERVSCRQTTPKRASFPSEGDRMSLSDDRRSSSQRKSYTGWDEARASSRALERSIELAARNDAHYEKLASYSLRQGPISQPPLLSSRRDSVAVFPGPPASHGISAMPLQFDLNRRPRAPFPPSADYFTSSSSALLDGQNHKSPSHKVDLPPCPPRMVGPSQMMRPAPAVPEKADRRPPIRPRRSTDKSCDIFSKAADDFAARVPATVVKRSFSPKHNTRAIPPRRQPPPSGPVPPLPLASESKASQSARAVLAAESWAKEVNTNRLSLLDRRAKKMEERQMQAHAFELKKRLSEASSSFGKDVMTSSFSASVPIRTCEELSQETQIDLIVAGVLFQTCFAELCQPDDVAVDGLVTWLREWALNAARSEDLDPAVSKMATIPLKLAREKRTSGSIEGERTSSYPSSFDSEDGNDEDDYEEEEKKEEEEELEELYSTGSLDYEMYTLRRLRCQSTEYALEKCLESISMQVKVPQLLQPGDVRPSVSQQRSPSHARTPTSVSIDLEDDEGSADGGDASMLSSTPDLIHHSHAFVFAKSARSSSPSPPTTSTACTSRSRRRKRKSATTTSDDSKDNHRNYVEVHLERNPQHYASVLHLLEHKSLPRYYISNSFPSLERRRNLLGLQRECSWLGYPSLAQVCQDALTAAL